MVVFWLRNVVYYCTYKTEMRMFSTFVSTIPNLEDLPITKLEILGKIGVSGYVFLSSTMIRWICLKKGDRPTNFVTTP